ncbi:MAG: YsnF/AvaK domain-containing protein [Phycisphaeraceae bacterium]
MTEQASNIVFGRRGLRGRIVGCQQGRRPVDDRVVIELDGGGRLSVHPDRLSRRADGSYALPGAEGPATPDEAPAAEQRIPLAEETARVGKRTSETAVRVKVGVHEREETVDLPLMQERVEVERVPVNRVVDQPPPVREEGDTLIVPLLEEVVEKKLMLREEVRITRHKSESRQPQRVTLRREEADIERVDQPARPPSSDAGPPADGSHG